MKRLLLFLFLALPASLHTLHAQNTIDIRICTYNVLNLGDNDYDRAGPLRTVLAGIGPDILVCQEMNNETGTAMLLDSALNFPAEANFRAVPFNNGPDTDNALFYNAENLEFIEARYHPGPLRDIAEYVLLPRGTTDTLVIFSMHLKAGNDAESEAQRAVEAEIVRGLLEGVAGTRRSVVAGDLNVYTSAEPAYLRLTDPGQEAETAYVADPLDMPGEWSSDSRFAAIHTQSTRGRQFGGGLHGGMDDRFDFILLSPALNAGHYRPGSYTTYGNDGNHFNDSINAAPNTAVPMHTAQALHDAGDHLPVYVDLRFPRTTLHVTEEKTLPKLPMGIW